MTPQPLTADSSVALVILAIALLGGMFYLASKIYFGVMRRRLEASNVSRVRVRDYVTSDGAEDRYRAIVSAGGKSETAIPAETETPRNAPQATPAFDVNVLRQEARAAALGSLLAHGLIVPGKRTEAMRAVFGKVTGDAYTRAAGAVKRHEQQVAATIPEQAADPPEAVPRLVPIAGGREGHFEI